MIVCSRSIWVSVQHLKPIYKPHYTWRPMLVMVCESLYKAASLSVVHWEQTRASLPLLCFVHTHKSVNIARERNPSWMQCFTTTINILQNTVPAAVYYHFIAQAISLVITFAFVLFCWYVCTQMLKT